MGNILDMQFMRYLNLFSRIARVQTTTCFPYNNTIVFAVPPSEVSRAIGRNAENVKEIAQILRKKIKIVGMARSKNGKDMEEFVAGVVSPLSFTKFEYDSGENSVVITANMQNKAGLIGRNSLRLQELQEALKRYYDVEKVWIA